MVTRAAGHPTQHPSPLQLPWFLARTRYAGANHTHLSELLSERDGIGISRTTLRRILVNVGLSGPRRRRPPKHRPLDPELCLEQVMCFTHRRRVARTTP